MAANKAGAAVVVVGMAVSVLAMGAGWVWVSGADARREARIAQDVAEARQAMQPILDHTDDSCWELFKATRTRCESWTEAPSRRHYGELCDALKAAPGPACDDAIRALPAFTAAR